MLEKTVKLTEEARKRGITIIHAPIVCKWYNRPIVRGS